MKKFLCAALALLMLVSVLAGCGGNKTESDTAQETTFDGDLNEYLAQVIDGAVDPEMALENIEVPEDLFSWVFFIDPVENAEAVASMPMIGSIPYTVGLIRLSDTESLENVREQIETNMDPRKWVCVEAEKTAVLRRGNLVLMAMGDTATVDKVTANFMALK